MGLFRTLARLLSGGGDRRSARPPSTTGFRTSSFRPRGEKVVLRPVPRGALPDRPALPQAGTVLKGQCWVIDGDTIIINKVRLRLAGIDAPELDHPYGQKAKWALVQLCKGHVVTAHIKPELS